LSEIVKIVDSFREKLREEVRVEMRDKVRGVQMETLSAKRLLVQMVGEMKSMQDANSRAEAGLKEMRVELNRTKDALKKQQLAATGTGMMEKSHMERIKQEIEEKFEASQNPECSLLPTNPCGECKCRDDDRVAGRYFCDCSNIPSKKDCMEHHRAGNRVDGIYRIKQENQEMRIFCDQTSLGGGWMVVQRRVDGSVSFLRGWDEYKTSFGSLQSNYWIGLDRLHLLTKQGKSELLVKVDDFKPGNQKHARYSTFQVGSEISSYKLKVSGYSGDASDGLAPQNGHKFSTYDRDNDMWPKNCAAEFKGAWWYDSCFKSNLNGRYYEPTDKVPYATSLVWDTYNGYHTGLKTSTMMIRNKQ